MKRERQAASRLAAWKVLTEAVKRLAATDASAEVAENDADLQNDGAALQEAERTFRSGHARLLRWLELNKPRGT